MAPIVTGYYSGGGEKTVAKLVILEKYIKAYLDIIPKYFPYYWYVDTHSGTGYSEEFGVPIPGSTLRALDYDFQRYYLYEKSTDHFDTLCESIEDYLGVSLQRSTRDDGINIAKCEDPYIVVNNDDCNSGVSWLARNGRQNSHWFTFVDPQKLSVTFDLMSTLISRGNMDILFNFQTDGYLRNAAEAAQHSHDKVTQGLGEDWPVDAEHDEYVRFYKRRVFEANGWNARSRAMVSEGANNWRYDLIFASENDTADTIMGDIMGKSLKRDVQDEIRKWRSKSDVSQQGIDTFVKIYTHGDEDAAEADDEHQTDLTGF